MPNERDEIKKAIKEAKQGQEEFQGGASPEQLHELEESEQERPVEVEHKQAAEEEFMQAQLQMRKKVQYQPWEVPAKPVQEFPEPAEQKQPEPIQPQIQKPLIEKPSVIEEQRDRYLEQTGQIPFKVQGTETPERKEKKKFFRL